ncbi:hypothetical protein RHGRI_026334 [Rhododendron griersonianum]|uniref:Uncharacterized protein n=1 Tax=Rhododendron griersonianum TaxID=479676 RepID=A0AAV6ITU0_9ERIC|nr:hypothetical protein RHGRI_026334 [Rhododendron griersonianum]
MMTKVSATVIAVMEGGNSAMVVAAMDVDEGRRGEGGVHRGEQARRRRSKRSRRCAGEEEEEQAASRRCDGDGRWVAMATRSLSLFVLKLWGGGGDGRWVAMFVAVRSEIVGERRRREVGGDGESLFVLKFWGEGGLGGRGEGFVRFSFLIGAN